MGCTYRRGAAAWRRSFDGAEMDVGRSDGRTRRCVQDEQIIAAVVYQCFVGNGGGVVSSVVFRPLN